MTVKRRSRFPLGKGQKFLLIFAATVLLPGSILTVFGTRALLEEGRRYEQQVRAELTAQSESLAERLEDEITRWRRTAEDAARFPDSPPARLIAATSDYPGGVAVVHSVAGRVRLIPDQQALYRFAELEAGHGGWEESGTPGDATRALMLHRQARTLQKAGQRMAALRIFRALEREPAVRLGTLPSDLVGAYEALRLEPSGGNAQRLLERLAAGRWQIEKASYAFYSGEVRPLLRDDADARRWLGIEANKLKLGRAAERYLEHPDSFLAGPDGYWLALSRAGSPAAVLLSEAFLRGSAWPEVFREAGALTGYALRAEDGTLLYGQEGGAGGKPKVTIAATAEPRLELEIWPADSAAREVGRRRERLYAATLGAMALLLAFGAYLSVRTVRSELRAAQIKDDFVAAVSHEFRSPLASLNQLGEMLRDGRVSDEGKRRDYYELIVGETRRLRRLVENVLDFSRIQDGREEYRRDPIATGEWLQEVAEEAQFLAEPAGVRIEAEIAAGLPGILGDREALSTAVHNLIDNAVKYSGDSKTVEYSARAGSGTVVISVRDFGAGIRVEDQPHIFEKFYRGANGTRQVKGAGLGLSLVMHIVNAHRGAVRFESREGEGSLFTIVLKAVE